MLEVWKRLLAMNKKMILVSDMYLPKECIVKILENAGYRGMEKVYLSNEYQKSKADGRLFGEIGHALAVMVVFVFHITP